MYFTIYKITNKINNKFYIGKHQTKNLNDGYMGSGKLIKAAIKKYGIENFEKQILYIFDNEAEMNAKEIELVIINEDSYNLCEGGKGGFGYINSNGLNGTQFATARKRQLRLENKEWFDKFRKTVSLSMKEYFKNNNGSFLGKKHTESTKAKLRKPKNIGSNNPSYGSCWVNNGKENRRISLKELDVWIDRGYNKGRRMHLYGDQVYKKAFLITLY